MIQLHYVVVGAAAAVLGLLAAVLLWALVRDRGSLVPGGPTCPGDGGKGNGPAAAPFAGARRPVLLVLLLLLCAHACFVWPRIPHNIWHEQHAVDLLTGIDDELGFGGLESLHGPTYALVLKGGRLLTGRALSVFALNHLVSLASVALLFLLVLLVSGSDLLGLVAASMLLFLPVHIRLSGTESVYVLVEFFCLLSLLLMALHLRTRNAWPLIAGALAALALMHLRAEMYLLFPLLLGAHLLILRRELPEGFLRETRVRGVLAGGALLAVPRFVEILAVNDQRIKHWTPATDWIVFEEGVQALNVFFDPHYTPILYPALFVLGLVYLYRKDRRVFGCALLHSLALTYFYSLHLSCVSLKVRTALATQFVFVAVAACGFRFVLDQAGERLKLPAYGLLFAALLTAPLAHHDFLGSLYTKQVEYLFLERIADTLPQEAVIVYLSEEDDDGLLQNRHYQRGLLMARAEPLRKDLVLLGIRRFLGLVDELDLKETYFYRGVPCVGLPWTHADPGTGAGTVDGYVHPLCRLMERAFSLEPVLETVVDRRSLSWDAIEGDRRRIGLYRVAARALGEGDFPGLGGQARADSGMWMLLTNDAEMAGQRKLALAALARAEKTATLGEKEMIADLREAMKEHTRAVTRRKPVRVRPAVPLRKTRSVWMSPKVREDLKRALDRFEKGDAQAGFEEYHRIVRVSDPSTSWPVEAYCGAHPGVCAPLTEARAGHARLNDEGIRLFGEGDRAGAVERFDRVLRTDPRDIDALINRAAVAVRDSEHERALELYGRVLRQDPAKPGLVPDVLSFRADVLAREGRRKEAVADLNRAIRSCARGSERRARLEADLKRIGAR